MNNHSRGLIQALSILDKVDRGAEVGVWRGGNAASMLKFFPTLYLYLIDTYNDDGLPTALSSKLTAAQAYLQARKAVAPYADRCEWMIRPSVEAAANTVDGLLDFVFIDADHSYESVKQDIEAWLPKVRSGGILAGHDYSIHHKGVKRAVQERFSERFKVADGKVWWVQKGVSSASV